MNHLRIQLLHDRNEPVPDQVPAVLKPEVREVMAVADSAFGQESLDFASLDPNQRPDNQAPPDRNAAEAGETCATSRFISTVSALSLALWAVAIRLQQVARATCSRRR